MTISQEDNRGEREARLQPGPALLIRVGVFLILATAAIGTSADADLWGHLRFGQDILRTGSIVQDDEYSFTSDRPWVNHEWLSEVAFAQAYDLAGVTGLVLLKLAVIVALLVVVWWHVRRGAPSTRAAAWIVVLAFVGTYWRTNAVRPQLFSILLFALFLVAMARADAGRRRGLLILPVLMALWVNLHGGWVVGLGVLAFWVGMRCLDRERPLAERVWLVCVGLVTGSATLLNPYGSGLWGFLAETVRFERPDIPEWESILAHPFLVGIPWTLTGAVAVLAVVRGGRPRQRAYIAIVALSALASARVSRLDAFYTLAVAILFAPGIARGWDSILKAKTSPGWLTPRRSGGAIVVTVLAVAAMLLSAARAVKPYVGCLPIRGSWVPDIDAERFIALNQLTGNLLTWFDWGEYAIWHFGPDLKVSMDGRRETVYSDAVIQQHRRFYAADGSVGPFLASLRPDYIWVARRLPIATQLSPLGWRPIFTSSVSVILAPAGGKTFETVSPALPGARCFPGP